MPQTVTDVMNRRLNSLRAEYQSGLEQKHALQERLERLDEILLRISGAITVIEETITETKTETETT